MWEVLIESLIVEIVIVPAKLDVRQLVNSHAIILVEIHAMLIAKTVALTVVAQVVKVVVWSNVSMAVKKVVD